MQASDVLRYAPARPLRRAEYDRLVSEGFFGDERVELIRGIVVEMSPIGPVHANPVDVLNELLVLALAGRARVRVQQPFVAADESEPEPDIAVVAPGSYAARHPDAAWLIVEVAESSLKHDRNTKAPLYAESGVEEYWIVDVTAQVVEVYDLPSGGRYGRVRTFSRGETLAPARFPDVTVAVDRLFE
jgi:Uma2 family endonuclease